MRNPEICKYDVNQYCVRFTRKSWKILVWVQDISGPKMKSNLVNRPAIIFSSQQEAERAIKETIIPYLLKEKDVEPTEIKGW